MYYLFVIVLKLDEAGQWNTSQDARPVGCMAVKSLVGTLSVIAYTCEC